MTVSTRGIRHSLTGFLLACSLAVGAQDPELAALDKPLPGDVPAAAEPVRAPAPPKAAAARKPASAKTRGFTQGPTTGNAKPAVTGRKGQRKGAAPAAKPKVGKVTNGKKIVQKKRK